MRQKRALATGLSLLLGALAGVVVGVNERGVSSSRPDAAAAMAGMRTSSESEPVGSPMAPPASVSAPVSSTEVPAPIPAPDITATLPVSAVTAELPPPSPAFDLTPPASKEELLAVETRCAGRVPEDCERAAQALDAGKILARDAARAKMLNRIALTAYVKQCESDRALACARLAEMHEHGQIVQKNPATAKVLRARFRELCVKKPAQPGCPAPGSSG